MRNSAQKYYTRHTRRNNIVQSSLYQIFTFEELRFTLDRSTFELDKIMNYSFQSNQQDEGGYKRAWLQFDIQLLFTSTNFEFDVTSDLELFVCSKSQSTSDIDFDKRGADYNNGHYSLGSITPIFTNEGFTLSCYGKAEIHKKVLMYIPEGSAPVNQKEFVIVLVAFDKSGGGQSRSMSIIYQNVQVHYAPYISTTSGGTYETTTYTY
jgi:hypothetical protein